MQYKKILTFIYYSLILTLLINDYLGEIRKHTIWRHTVPKELKAKNLTMFLNMQFGDNST